MKPRIKIGVRLASFFFLSIPISVHSLDIQTVRDAAMQMMGASLFVPGLAAYCDKFVAPNAQLLDAAGKWTTRNTPLMKMIVKAVKRSGDTSAEEKSILDRFAFKLTKETVEAQPDPKEFCANLTGPVNDGTLDLDRREDLAGARKVIWDLP
jgi:hypothetical protein